MKILITGTAGFIGFHLTRRLLADGHDIVGLDNLNEYYDVNLKYARLKELGICLSPEQKQSEVFSVRKGRLQFVRCDLTDKETLLTLFRDNAFNLVVHLAAQAGVRYSLDHPQTYVDSNVTGFLNILEACRRYPVSHLIYASSSSVYGLNTDFPYSEKDRTDQPVSLYAATKKADEMLAHTYSHLFSIPVTGLRFFTVYGPWGRPDMAFFKFTDAILHQKSIEVYNHGKMARDFTYIDDILDGILGVMKVDAPRGNPPCDLYNIGLGYPVNLMDFIRAIESACGKTADIRYQEMQPGDVLKTHADISALQRKCDYHPKTDIQTGMKHFVEWYKTYYHLP
ncbi:MAG: NAD-dependent epimerase/dehydratase [Marinimicrobia bacterium 46_43]|nr:MAG: NAD-dependent epimerase/dehydratase [Marinimicrobia bacterium 46_43]